MTFEWTQVAVLALVGAVFFEALRRDWDGVYLVFGIVFLMGSCQMMGIK